MKNRVTLAGWEARITLPGGGYMNGLSKDHDPLYAVSAEGRAKIKAAAAQHLIERLTEIGAVTWRPLSYDVDVPTDLLLPCGAEWLGGRDDTYQCDSPEGHEGLHTFTLEGGTLRWQGEKSDA